MARTKTVETGFSVTLELPDKTFSGKGKDLGEALAKMKGFHHTLVKFKALVTIEKENKTFTFPVNKVLAGRLFASPLVQGVWQRKAELLMK